MASPRAQPVVAAERPIARVVRVALVVLAATGCAQAKRLVSEWTGGTGTTDARGGAGGGGAERGDRQTIYAYPGPRGRTVYVNGLDMVPAEHRASARALDLSHISLNEELGTQIAAQVDAELEAAAASEPCRVAQGVAAAGGVRQAWDAHGPLIATAGVLLLIALLTPFMLREVGATWGRTLLWLLPLVGVVGILAHVAVRTTRAMTHAKAAAGLCTGGVRDASPDSVAARFERLNDLHRALEQVQREAGLASADGPGAP